MLFVVIYIEKRTKVQGCLLRDVELQVAIIKRQRKRNDLLSSEASYFQNLYGALEAMLLNTSFTVKTPKVLEGTYKAHRILLEKWLDDGECLHCHATILLSRDSNDVE